MSEVDKPKISIELSRIQDLIDEVKSADEISKEAFQSIRGLIYQPPHYEGMGLAEVSKVKAMILVLANLLRSKGWEELADKLVTKPERRSNEVTRKMVEDFRGAIEKK